MASTEPEAKRTKWVFFVHGFLIDVFYRLSAKTSEKIMASVEILLKNGASDLGTR
jgi:hypothetical protein